MISDDTFYDIFNEARRNPEVNVKDFTLDILNKYKDDPDVYLIKQLEPLYKIYLDIK